MTRKKEKVNSLNIFKGFYLKYEVKILQIHKHGWLSITWILKKLNSIQALLEDIPEIKLFYWSFQSKTYRNSHLITRTLIFLNNFCVLF